MSFGFGPGGWYGGEDEDDATNVKPDGYVDSRKLAGRARGPHAGKGPVGFHRTDARLRERVCEALEDDDYVDATEIEVALRNCEVILVGCVDDRTQRRLAEECVLRVPGICGVQNHLRIAAR